MTDEIRERVEKLFEEWFGKGWPGYDVGGRPLSHFYADLMTLVETSAPAPADLREQVEAEMARFKLRLPVGEATAWDAIKVIQEHCKEMDAILSLGLREALDWIASRPSSKEVGQMAIPMHDYFGDYDLMVAKARAALARTEKGEQE